jgi:ribonuclease HI
LSLIIQTHGSCEDGLGEWSYTIHYRDTEGACELLQSAEGESKGSTARQMHLMAILNALSHAKSLEFGVPILLKSACHWCVKCIRHEYDCVSDDEYKRDKVSRGYVQYLQEIWWKVGDLKVTFLSDTDNSVSP